MCKYDDSVRSYEEAIRINPQDADTWNNKGVTLDFLGKYVDAIYAYNKATEFNSQHGNAWYNKGVSECKKCLDEGNLSYCNAAIRSFERAIEIRPFDAEVWYRKGIALRLLGCNNEANLSLKIAQSMSCRK
jgi:Flp pilus assembly protein TadD